MIAVAYDLRLPHAGQTLETVEQVDESVIAECSGIVPAVFRIQCHDLQNGRRKGIHGHAVLTHYFRQHGRGGLHSVVDVHLSHIGIGAHGKSHGNLHGSARRADGAHVDHVGNAVDLFLDGCGHGFGNDFGTGSRILGADRNRRRNEIRILRHRQHPYGKKTSQHDEYGQHYGKNGPAQKEPRPRSDGRCAGDGGRSPLTVAAGCITHAGPP